MCAETKKAESPVEEKAKPSNFIRDFIDEDIAAGRWGAKVHTRFPPEPNGYLHIGHAKSICLNFGIAKDYNGQCNLRFDDTNPTKEDVEYVDSIKEDIHWLGFDWEDREYYASDYFEQLYQWAEYLIEQGKAYVDELSLEEIKEYRGNYYKKAKESPWRNRPAEESLDLFRRMRAGEFGDGEKVLRAKGDLESPNMNLRDPIMYRIRRVHHHRTGDKWCIYPMYDWAHGQSDAIEGISHSICTLEFENHRPLYDWFTANLPLKEPPQQIEFARLNLTYTVMSKRMLLQLVEEKHVLGWDDPRMPTVSGLRRRGFTPASIRNFADQIGVAKADSTVDVGLLEYCVREDLNQHAPRVMAVLNPLKVTITNMKDDEVVWFDAPLHPEDESYGTRRVPLTRELYVERDDFMEDAPKKWFRLAPGKEVRLRYACLLTCTEAVKDPATGEVTELLCTWDPESHGGKSPDGRRVRGTLHWVSASHAVDAEVRLYDRLFTKENPMDADDGKTFKDYMNPDSLQELTHCKAEPHLATAQPEDRFQFERLGYFVADRRDHNSDHPVFNRTVTLRDSWAKIAKKQAPEKGKKKQAKKNKEQAPQTDANTEKYITINDVSKLDLRVGMVRHAELVEGADKLLKVMVDLGEARERQIFAGIRASYPDPAVLVGRRVIVVANLKPRKMRFGMSEGMILAGGGGTENLGVATFDTELKPGDKVS